MQWPCIGHALAMHWPRVGQELARHWPCIGQELARHWPGIGHELASSIRSVQFLVRFGRLSLFAVVLDKLAFGIDWF
eukprot:8224833-Lingulodinium_polyedra.AAC.1